MEYKKALDSYWALNDFGWEKVAGYPVIIAGYETLDLFAHHSLDKGKEWSITEGVTGMAIVQGGKDKDDAINRAIKKIALKKMTLEKLKIKIGYNVKARYRLSPRYNNGIDLENTKTIL